VHVPDSSVADVIESRPAVPQVGGKFDQARYKAALSNFSAPG